MAAAFVRNGAKRVYIASRKLDDLKVVAEQLNKISPNGGSGKGEQRSTLNTEDSRILTMPIHTDAPVVALQADIATKAGCDSLANQIKERETEVDVLINNAGITWGAPMDDFPEEKGWDKTFHLNVKSQFYLTVALLPLLEKNKSNTKPASVINIASTAAIVPNAESGLSAPGHGTWSCKYIYCRVQVDFVVPFSRW